MAKNDDAWKKTEPANETHPERSATVKRIFEKPTHYPCIRLLGHRLQMAEFHPEPNVSARVMPDCLVIRGLIRKAEF
jgi:hypothetical protein